MDLGSSTSCAQLGLRDDESEKEEWKEESVPQLKTLQYTESESKSMELS